MPGFIAPFSSFATIGRTAVLAAGESFSLRQVAVQFGVSEQAADPVSEFRGVVRSLLQQTEIRAALSDSQWIPLVGFANGEPVLEESELERPLNALLKIREGESPAPPTLPDVPAAALVVPPAQPHGALFQEQPEQVRIVTTPEGEQYRLIVKPLFELMSNDRIVRPRPGGLEVTLLDADNLSVQDMFDGYQLFFHQAKRLRDLLQELRDRGADVQPLAEPVAHLSSTLIKANSNLRRGFVSLVRAWLEIADVEMQQLQEGIRAIAATLGLTIDAFTGHLHREARRPGQLPGIRDVEAPVLPAEDPPVMLPPATAALEPEPPTPAAREPIPDTIPRHYQLCVGPFNPLINFNEHDRYVLTKNRHGQWNVFPESLATHLEVVGVFQLTPRGLAFEPLEELPVTVDKGRNSIEMKIGEARLVAYRVKTPVADFLRQQMKATPLNLAQEGLLRRLASKEAEEAGLQKRGGHRQYCVMFGNRNRFEPLYGSVSFDGMVEDAATEDILPLLTLLFQFMKEHPDSLLHRTTRILKALLAPLSDKQQSRFIASIAEMYLSRLDQTQLKNTDIQQDDLFEAQIELLTELATSFGVSARIKMLRELEKRVFGEDRVKTRHLQFLGEFASGLPEKAVRRELKKAQSVELKRFLYAYFGGLPMVGPIYDHYRRSDNPKEFLTKTVERVRYFLHGGRIFSHDADEHLAFAYASLDQPEQLSFEQFARDISLDDLPPPFMHEQFKVRVPIVSPVHVEIDKGILRNAQQRVARVHVPEQLVAYLKEVLAQPKKHGLKKFKASVQELLLRYANGREDLEHHTDVVSVENVVSLAEDLLKLLNAAGSRMTPQLREVVVNLVIGLASAEEAATHLLPVISGFHEKLPAEKLVEALTALREFYQDSVEVVLQRHAELPQLPVITKLQKQLEDQVSRVENKVDETLDVMMVPSKSQTDAFAGYVGEDCTKSRWKKEIRSPDAQIYRMVAHKRLMGVVYLKRAVLDGQVVLVLGIEPRTRFRVQHRDLLRQVIAGLAKNATKSDYDYILFSTSRGQRSNRPDMNEAIDKECTKKVEFQQSVGGSIFSGNSFQVAWQRPADTPKGPAPKVSAPVSFDARTVMGFEKIRDSDLENR